MRYVTILRLLLEVFGAAFLGVMLIAVLVYGVLPYEGLMRLGSILFYALMACAFAIWVWLAAKTHARRDARIRRKEEP